MPGQPWPQWSENEIDALALGYMNDIIAANDQYGCFAAIANTSRSRSNNWRSDFLLPPGKTLLGARESSVRSAHASPLCASGQPIGTTGKPNLTRKSGC